MFVCCIFRIHTEEGSALPAGQFVASVNNIFIRNGVSQLTAQGLKLECAGYIVGSISYNVLCSNCSDKSPA